MFQTHDIEVELHVLDAEDEAGTQGQEIRSELHHRAQVNGSIDPVLVAPR